MTYYISNRSLRPSNGFMELNKMNEWNSADVTRATDGKNDNTWYCHYIRCKKRKSFVLHSVCFLWFLAKIEFSYFQCLQLVRFTFWTSYQQRKIIWNLLTRRWRDSLVSGEAQCTQLQLFSLRLKNTVIQLAGLFISIWTTSDRQFGVQSLTYRLS